MAVGKKSLFSSYVDGITDQREGERYSTILRYFLPELITAFLINALLSLIDSSIIGHLKSTSLYATKGVTDTFIHFLTKIAEGISVGTVVLCGQYNGQKKFVDVGKAAMSAFWVTLCLGGIVSGFLYFGAFSIYNFYHVPSKMVRLGVPFLQLRAVGIFLAFLYFALIGFLRGIKNTRLPMLFFLFGGIFFVFFDYGLVFGCFGLPEMGLRGSAIASIIQYSVMLLSALSYIFLNKSMRCYSLNIIKSVDRFVALDIIRLSWPVVLDKAVLAATKIWIARLLAPMGKVVIASFAVVKDMEQLAFVPAIALAQVITLLVSNDYGNKNWSGITNNIKKTLFLASVMVFGILCFFALWPELIISLFDAKGAFVRFAATAFPILSVLVFFDVLQVILSGALRGAANVRVVMVTRFVVCIVVLFPLSYAISLLPIANVLVKFILVYSTFYLADGIMGMVYVLWFRYDRWKTTSDITAARKETCVEPSVIPSRELDVFQHEVDSKKQPHL